MRLTSPARRAAGLLAATTIGLSTAVLGVTGVAFAADEPVTVTDSPASGASPSATDGLPPTSVTTSSPELAAAAVPGAPFLDGLPLENKAERTVIDFWPEDADASTSPVTGWEYSLDNGTWLPLATEDAPDDRQRGVLTGLAFQHDYSLRVRAQSAAGPGLASRSVSFHRYVAPPANIRADVGVGSITVSWSPPAGATGIQGYYLDLLPGADPQSDQGRVECPTPLGADARSCTVAVPAGQPYSVYLAATDGDVGYGAYLVSAVVPAPVAATPPAAPTALPTASAPLTSSDSDGRVKVGERVTLTGDGYLPGSTVELLVYSTPVSLGTVVAGADGRFTATVTLPTGLANGQHHLVSSGVDANGNPRYLVSAITVSGGSGLAYTGFTPMPYIGAGVLALLAGGGLLVASRRRA